MGDFDFNVIIDSLPFLWQGLQLSLFLTFLAIVGGIILGTLLALARLSGIWPLSINWSRPFAVITSFRFATQRRNAS